MSSLDTVAGRFAYTEDHEAFRQTVRSFLQKEGVPPRGAVGGGQARPQILLDESG